MDMVCQFYLNVGGVANFVRSEGFPLNNCPYRRLLYWNEPSICPGGEESVKMLAGGDPCVANIKHGDHITIPRTPLVVTGNGDTFLNCDMMKSRVSTFYWKEAPFLQKLQKKPHPMTTFALFKQFY